jgi:hypothetical protein
MSNVSNISPYEESPGSSAVVAGAMAGAVATAVLVGGVVQWLTEETDADRIVAQRRQTEAKERMQANINKAAQAPAGSTFESARLRGKEMEPLLEAARALGYIEVVGQQAGVHCLMGKEGQRVAIGHAANGNLELHARAGDEAIQAMVRQFTVTQAVRHMQARDMKPVVSDAGGATVIQGRETGPGKSAVLTAQVRADGRIAVDVDQMSGPRCEDLVRDLASAVGGQVESTRRKPQFWLPGEPAKTKKQVKL